MENKNSKYKTVELNFPTNKKMCLSSLDYGKVQNKCDLAVTKKVLCPDFPEPVLLPIYMRAVLLVLLLSQVPARPRMEDMEEDMENNILELDLPPAQEDDDQLDKEQMLWMRRRGGLLQPDWILRTINQDPKITWNQEKRQRTELENILKFITEYYLRKQEKISAFFMRG